MCGVLVLQRIDTMGRWRAIVPIILAFVIAGAGSYFVHQWLMDQTKPPQVVMPEKKTESVPVVVAAADIEWGTKLNADMLKQLLFPKSGVIEDYFRDPEAVIGRVAQTPIKANVPIMESFLAPESVEGGGITAIIKKGHRAIAVAGNKVLGLSGLITPGNRVDVLLTTADPVTGNTLTKTVLENLLVLAAGAQMKRETTLLGDEKLAPVDVYTLEVTPEQAERITLAASKGKLSFALRSFSDTDVVLTRGQMLTDLLGSYREDPAMIAGLFPDKEKPEEDAVVDPEPEPEEVEAATVEKPCEPCVDESDQETAVDLEPEIYSGPEVQVEILNGNVRKVRKYKM